MRGVAKAFNLLGLSLRPMVPQKREINRYQNLIHVFMHRLFLTAMAIHLSLRVAPPDLQQGGNSRISSFGGAFSPSLRSGAPCVLRIQ